MNLFRVTKRKYADNLSGYGAKMFGGRWNKKGTAALYTSETSAGAVLESLAHLYNVDDLDAYTIVRLTLPEFELLVPKMKINNWSADISYTQNLGSDLLENKEVFGFKIPSVIDPFGYNVILNPLHPNYTEIHLKEKKDFTLDPRLFSLTNTRELAEHAKQL